MCSEDSADGGTLAVEDVRTIVRLLGSVADLEGTPVEKKHALMDGLSEMLGVSAWLWVVSRFDPGSHPMAVHVHGGGFSDRDIGLIFEAHADTDHPLPELEPLTRLMLEGKPFARRRVDLVPDDGKWRGESFRIYRGPIGVDEFLYGFFPIAGHLVSGIGLHRKIGEKGFTERDRQILQIVVTEIPWLHRAGLPELEQEELAEYGKTVMDLTPRLRTVLGLLLQGWRRPQIADHLGITENTAKCHIRDVYRHFEVADHVALLRRFMHAGI